MAVGTRLGAKTRNMISDALLQEAIRWKPHKNQEEILKCVEREVVIAAGRRFGKSALCAYIALKMLLEPNKKIWIVAPTYDLTGKVFEYVVKWFSKVAPSQREGISYRPYPKIRTAQGSVLECRSTENPTGLLGEEVDLEIVDEAARIPRYVYDTYLYPVTSSRKGRMISISTPFGMDHFYEKWLHAKEKGAAFQFSSKDGVSVDDEEWALMQARLPSQVFKQEYMALFQEDAAGVFRNVRGIVADQCLEAPRADRRYVMGVDLGRVNDFSVLTVIDTFTHKVVAWERFKDLDYFLQTLRIKGLAQKYNKAKIIIDSSNVGQAVVEQLKRAGVENIEDFKFSNKSKKELVEKLSLFIDNRGITIPNEPILTDELAAFSYEITDAKNVTYNAPQGKHDDCVISLALAVWGLSTYKKENPAVLRKPQRKKLVFQFN